MNTDLIEMTQFYNLLVNQMGDCPNKEIRTNGGKQFWTTIQEKDGYILQQNLVSRHARILNSDKIRKAWGSLDIMKEKFRRMTSDEFLEPGDIIGITRRSALCLYDHYAVYIGGERVIHYSREGHTVHDHAIILEESLPQFLQKDKNYFILHFSKPMNPPQKIQSATEFLVGDDLLSNTLELGYRSDARLYTPEETVARAKSRLGETSYNLVVNNCEHFALWCKTGVSESRQVRQKINLLQMTKLVSRGNDTN